MAADSRTTRRGTGRNAESDKRRTARRGAGDEDERTGRARAAPASRGGGRKTASRKTATSSRKTGGGTRESEGRKATATRKSASKRTAPKGAGRGEATARGSARKAASSRRASASARGGRSAAGEAKRARRGKQDALALLKEDHERVDDMFRKFERMKQGDERKRALLRRILEEVRVHAQIEEELFYPALRSALEDNGKDKEMKLLDEADVEHETVKWLMAELEGGALESSMVDARMKVMAEYIRHHVEEEEGQIFRAAKRAKLDLAGIGRQIEARKGELAGGAGEGEAEATDEAAAMAALGSGDSADRGARPSMRE